MESLNFPLSLKSIDQMSAIHWNKGVTDQGDPNLYMSLSEQH